MQTLESLKRKIGSAEDLQTVVRTMKTLAAVSIRQYETAAESLAEYAATVDLGIAMLRWNASGEWRDTGKRLDGATGAIVFGSDQGLCGPFNDHLVQYMDEQWEEDRQAAHRSANRWPCLAIGTRIAARLEDGGYVVDEWLSNASSSTGIAPLVHELLERIDRWQRERRLGRILLFHNRRVSAASYPPHGRSLLPIDRSVIESHAVRRWPSRSLPLVTLDAARFFSRLVQQYLFVTLFRACAESLAGENASRIASMQSAERSIEERLAELRGEYHQLRQTSITEELLDVVTGFEVLRDGGASAP